MPKTQITAIVTQVIRYRDLLETTHGPAWAAIDTKMEESAAKLTVNLQQSHSSLLRRTIAINIEYELKRELLEVASCGIDELDDEDIHKATINSALAAANNADETRTKSILWDWFLETPHSLNDFKASMQLLKVASGAEHPTSDLDGNPIELFQARKIVTEDFEIPSDSRQAGQKWTKKEKATAVYYLEKLWVIRVNRLQTCFLLA